MFPTSPVDRIRTIQSEIVINAPQQLVWNILVDLPRYEEWNPFIYWSEPLPQAGNVFNMKVRMEATYNIDLPTKLFRVEAPNLVIWSGRKYPTWMVEGMRHQKLTPIDATTTHFHSWEVFTGWLSVLALFTQGKNVKRGFDVTCATLKARAEQFYRDGRTG